MSDISFQPDGEGGVTILSTQFTVGDEVPHQVDLGRSDIVSLMALSDAGTSVHVEADATAPYARWADLEIEAAFEGVTLRQFYENRCDSEVFISRDQLAEVASKLIRLSGVVESMKPEEPGACDE